MSIRGGVPVISVNKSDGGAHGAQALSFSSPREDGACDGAGAAGEGVIAEYMGVVKGEVKGHKTATEGGPAAGRMYGKPDRWG